MFGLILIYFVGNAFYKLAWQHEKSKWGYAILGIISYYAGLFIGGALLGAAAILLQYEISETQESVLGLLALPFGVLSCWGLYKLLERRWSGVESVPGNPDILDEDFTAP